MIRNLKRLRDEAGLSQKKLADALKINQQSINGYENRNNEPDIEMLINIAEYFHTSIDFLVGHETRISDNENNISHEELLLLKNFRLLPKDVQVTIRQLIENILNHSIPNEK